VRVDVGVEGSRAREGFRGGGKCQGTAFLRRSEEADRLRQHQRELARGGRVVARAGEECGQPGLGHGEVDEVEHRVGAQREHTGMAAGRGAVAHAQRGDRDRDVRAAYEKVAGRAVGGAVDEQADLAVLLRHHRLAPTRIHGRIHELEHLQD